MARRPNRVAPFRPVKRKNNAARRRKSGLGDGFIPLLILAPLAAFIAVFVWDGGPGAGPLDFMRSKPAATAQDAEAARFSRCSGPVRINCVVDGDTFWYQGEKIRISDINTPEVGEPGCAHEARLGARATERLQALLNEGAFSLETEGSRDTDRYGRSLRVVTRGGESLGAVLVEEGLAERWSGRRRNWC